MIILDRLILSELNKTNNLDSLKFPKIQFFPDWTLEETKQKLIAFYQLKNKINEQIDLRIWKFDHTLSEQQVKEHLKTQILEKKSTI